MTETNKVTSSTSITTEIVVGKMNLALTKVSIGIQQLNDMEGNLVYNEDNISFISAYIDKAKQAKKVIESEHKAIKEPFLREGQIIDESKRNMLAQIDVSLLRAQTNYTKLCTDIENRKKAILLDNERKQNIKTGIDNNMIEFSGKITSCKTNSELLSIERMINLEKGKPNKYMEFNEEAVEKYNSLTVILTAQKQTVKEFEKSESDRIAAEKSGNDEAILKAREESERLAQKIDESKIIIQEEAINSTMTSTTVQDAVEVLPEVNVKRKSWTWEVIDIQKTAKSNPAWVKMETVDEKIDEFLKASKESWAEEKVEEKIISGVRFYIKKRY